MLNNGNSPALLTVSAGTHTIGAPTVLDSNVTLLPAAGSQLTISGGLSGGRLLAYRRRSRDGRFQRRQ